MEDIINEKSFCLKFETLYYFSYRTFPVFFFYFKIFNIMWPHSFSYTYIQRRTGLTLTSIPLYETLVSKRLTSSILYTTAGWDYKQYWYCRFSDGMVKAFYYEFWQWWMVDGQLFSVFLWICAQMLKRMKWAFRCSWVQNLWCHYPLVGRMKWIFNEHYIVTGIAN